MNQFKVMSFEELQWLAIAHKFDHSNVSLTSQQTLNTEKFEFLSFISFHILHCLMYFALGLANN